MNQLCSEWNRWISTPVGKGVLGTLFMLSGASAQELEKPEPEILSIRVEQGDFREVVIEEAAPIFREKATKEVKTRIPLKIRGDARTQPGGSTKREVSYILVATVFKEGVTQLKWRSTSGADDGKSVAYSAYDWTSM